MAAAAGGAGVNVDDYLAVIDDKNQSLAEDAALDFVFAQTVGNRIVPGAAPAAAPAAPAAAPMASTLAADAEIVAGNFYIWNDFEPKSEVEAVHRKIELIRNKLSEDPAPAAAVVAALTAELERLQGAGMQQAYENMYKHVKVQSTLNAMAQLAPLDERTAVFVDAPTIGATGLTNGQMKSLDTTFAKQKLSGDGDNPDYVPVLRRFSTFCSGADLNQDALYHACRYIFDGFMLEYVSSCEESNTPFAVFWHGIQRMLAKASSPLKLMHYIQVLKSRRPTEEPTVVFIKLMNLHRLLLTQQGNATWSRVATETRESIFFIVREHYPAFYNSISSQDRSRMSLFTAAAHDARNGVGDISRALQIYHPITGLIHLIGAHNLPYGQPQSSKAQQPQYHQGRSAFQTHAISQDDPENVEVASLRHLSVKDLDIHYGLRRGKKAEAHHVDQGRSGQGSGWKGAGQAGPRSFGGEDKRRCFNCRELGHIARDCPKPNGSATRKEQLQKQMAAMALELEALEAREGEDLEVAAVDPALNETQAKRSCDETQ